jgi:hypothetical protein
MELIYGIVGAVLATVVIYSLIGLYRIRGRQDK